ncbi:hypothetical protein VSR01_17245 [Actinacidiphila sp. DG2A-62]|uniref:hypothetical protein n=1 Tax=Actinacidiphila sp. DG2A-62 TaxID=3108821 RepID=UPI002DBF6F61|nr:hypothetical protein [Actinacidiphila sp. DG2A-62]MEC3995184.1 hypothetical protein [Actinacidiphila sp. DG2A-62]
MSDLRLATCTYQEFAPHMGTPVRTTAGHPRFPLSYQLGGHARLITPTRDLLKINVQDAYEWGYRRLLNGHGFQRIEQELAGIAGANELDSPLVLLCFDRLDRLTPPDDWCHRLHFAKWWTEQTGDEVPELGAHRKQAPPTLFDA